MDHNSSHIETGIHVARSTVLSVQRCPKRKQSSNEFEEFGATIRNAQKARNSSVSIHVMCCKSQQPDRQDTDSKKLQCQSQVGGDPQHRVKGDPLKQKDTNIEAFEVKWSFSETPRDVADSKSTSGGMLCVFGDQIYVPKPRPCKKQRVVSHNSTEAEVPSLDIGLGKEGYQDNIVGYCD